MHQTLAMTVVPFAVLLFATHAFGQSPKPPATTASREEASPVLMAGEALETLLEAQDRGSGVLINQSDLDPLIHKGGGGACPSAAALVAYQTMRLQAGFHPDRNPFRTVTAAFAADPSLLRGRLTNTQFAGLLRHYGEQLEGASFKVDVISAPNSPHAAGGTTWTVGGSPELTESGGVVRILSYTVTRDSGEVLGRHFVIQKSFDGGKLRVVDPNALGKDYWFTLENDASGLGRVFLRFPPGRDFPVTNELNTVFEVRVGKPTASGRYTPTESSPIARVLSETDVLAAKLHERGELRSPRVWRREGARIGLPALDLPAEFGGAGWGAEKMLEVFRHAGRYDLNLRDVVGGAHGRVLLKASQTEVRDVVQQVADGNAYIAIVITEPTAGSDYTAMKSRCTKVDGGYHLNGVKRFNARLDQATHVVVFTESNTGKPGRMNVFLLPTDAEGLRIERFGAHGLTGNSYGGMAMENVFVPDSHRIGEEDDGYHLFNDHFRYWRLMQTAAAVGTAERALEMMAERLKTRHVFGGPIGRFTHLQQPLAEYTIKLRMVHALSQQAARLLDRGDYERADILINGLKAEGVEIALGAVDSAVRAFGGEGYSDRVDLGDRLRDLNGLRIADGTTDVMRSSVVAKVYGKEFWEMAIQRRD